MPKTVAAGQKFLTFLEMIKFEHSVFALPFAYLGLFLAERGLPRISLFFGVTLAMVSFRTLSMALNRLIDQTVDGLNPRTAGRALPAGRLKRSYVWCWAVGSFAIFEYTAFKLSPLCLALSPVPAVLAVLYPYTKRFTWLSHFVLGTVLGIAPYGAWLASRGEFSWIPGLWTLGVVFWVAGFDIIYALQDEMFDREFRLYSFPAVFGKEASLNLTKILHGLTVLSWLAAGILAHLGGIYFSGMMLVIVFLMREHWLIRSFGLEKIEEAFFQMNATVSVSVFAAVFLDIMVKKWW